MHKSWRCEDFAWAGQWDHLVLHALALLEFRLPYLRASASILGSQWVADTKKTACALLGRCGHRGDPGIESSCYRLTDSNTATRTSTAELLTTHGGAPSRGAAGLSRMPGAGIELLVKAMKEATTDATFTSRNAAYAIRNLVLAALSSLDEWPRPGTRRAAAECLRLGLRSRLWLC